MLAHRLVPALLLVAAGLGIRGAAAAPAAEALSLPFAHQVGARWGLRFEREERRGESVAPKRLSEAQAQVLSPYGRDLLVEVRWRRVVEGAQATELEPRRAASAQALDELGGGRWLLRVDLRGTALGLLNAEEARAALARARGGALDDATWVSAEADLLEGWNVVYGACGVPLLPSTEHVTPLLAGDVEAGHDARTLLLEHAEAPAPETGRPPRLTALSVNARTHVRYVGGQGLALERTSSTRYELASGRLSGWRLSVRTTPHAAGREPGLERVVERLAFAELPLVEVAEPPTLARR